MVLSAAMIIFGDREIGLLLHIDHHHDTGRVSYLVCTSVRLRKGSAKAGAPFGQLSPPTLSPTFGSGENISLADLVNTFAGVKWW